MKISKCLVTMIVLMIAPLANAECIKTHAGIRCSENEKTTWYTTGGVSCTLRGKKLETAVLDDITCVTNDGLKTVGSVFLTMGLKGIEARRPESVPRMIQSISDDDEEEVTEDFDL